MKSRPLTLTEKDSIKNAAMRHRFDKEEDELLKTEHVLARKVHAALYPDAKVMAHVWALGTDWCDTYYDLFVRTPKGHRLCLKIANTDKLFRMRRNAPDLLTDHALIAEIDALESAREDIKKRRSEAAQKIVGLLHSVNTTKQLLDIWPEGREIYGQIITLSDAGPRGKLPAVRVAEVNELLGLNKHEPNETPAQEGTDAPALPAESNSVGQQGDKT